MPRKQTSSHTVVKQLKNGWYYRLGSSAMYAWHGPFKTRRDAEWLRGKALDGLIGLFDELARHLEKRRSKPRA
jgi:hypothetical protein